MLKPDNTAKELVDWIEFLALQLPLWDVAKCRECPSARRGKLTEIVNAHIESATQA